MKIKITDINFYGEEGSSKFQPPSLFSWYRGTDSLPVHVYTDVCIPMAFRKKQEPSNEKSIAWLLEPFEINPYPYHFVFDNVGVDKFFAVFTHDKRLVDAYENVYYVTQAGTWLPEDKRVDQEKTDLVSIIASHKSITEGHRMRHKIVRELSESIDVFGYGYNPLDCKSEGLSKYKFSFAVENSQVPGYFSEKIIDCFLTKTIPIYWGDPCIGDIFDTNGIIIINSGSDLGSLISQDLDSYYRNNIDSVQKNYEIAHHYLSAEDMMWPILYNIIGEN